MANLISITDTDIPEAEWERVHDTVYQIREAITRQAEAYEDHSDYFDFEIPPIFRALDQLNGLGDDLEHLSPRELLEIFESICSQAEDGELDLSEHYEEIEEALTILEITEGKLLYIHPELHIEIPRLIVPVSEDFLRLCAKDPDLMFKISPRKFEEIIAEIFSRNGFMVELTKMTRDGGKDIIAVREIMGIPLKLIIECKRYAKTRSVSIGMVQRLLGVKVATAANKAILATTSKFSRDAVNFAQNYIWDLSLKDHNDIVNWLRSGSNLGILP